MLLKERLKDARENLGMSRVELADLLHISPKEIYNYEKGASEIRNDILIELLRILNISKKEYDTYVDKEKDLEKEKVRAKKIPKNEFMDIPEFAKYADPLRDDEKVYYEGNPIVNSSKAIKAYMIFIGFVFFTIFLLIVLAAFLLIKDTWLSIILLVVSCIFLGVGIYIVFGHANAAAYKCHYIVTDKRIIKEIKTLSITKRYEIKYDNIESINLNKLERYSNILFTLKNDLDETSGKYFNSLDYLQDGSRVYAILKELINNI